MSNHEIDQEIVKTDDGFSEKKMALKVDKLLVQLAQAKPKTNKKVTKQDNVIYEEK